MHKETLLLTGGTGFLGSNIKPLLENDYVVKTLGQSVKNDYCTDLCTGNGIKLHEKFNVVVHAAAKTRNVSGTDEENRKFYDINYNGTSNLCNTLEDNPPDSFIFISTVAVYGCTEGINISEAHPLNANSHYGKSKILAEKFLTDWCGKHNINLVILRPSLIVGVNSSGNLGAMINAIRKGRYFSIGGGRAKKSFVLVENIAEVIPLLHKQNKNGIYNLCNTNSVSFRELESIISYQLNCNVPFNIPLWIARLLACAGNLLGNKAPINYSKLQKLTNDLTFSNKKICNELNWKPKELSEDYRFVQSVT